MPVGTNSIDSFSFIALLGNREPPRQQLGMGHRPSVDGLVLTRTGSRGNPFRLRSQVDAVSYDAAHAEFRKYLALVNANPVTLIQGGIVSTAEGYVVQVLDVRTVRVGPMRVASGGLNPPSLAWLECDWDLVAIAQV